MSARDLIQSLKEGIETYAAQRLYVLLSKAGVNSSSHCGTGYDLRLNVEPLYKLAEMVGNGRSDLMAVVNLYVSAEEGMPGQETLWELTKDPRLWELCDFNHEISAGLDTLAVSYFYGSDTRRDVFRKYGSHDPLHMAESIYHTLVDDGCSKPGAASLEGNVVTFEADDYTWSPEEITDGLIRSGWDVELTLPTGETPGTMVVHGYNRQSAMKRLLST